MKLNLIILKALNSTLKYRTITSLIIASDDEKNHQVEDLISLDG